MGRCNRVMVCLLYFNAVIYVSMSFILNSVVNEYLSIYL